MVSFNEARRPSTQVHYAPRTEHEKRKDIAGVISSAFSRAIKMIDGQGNEAARKWEEFQNLPTGGDPQQKGRVP
jgi:hypothetical protein